VPLPDAYAENLPDQPHAIIRARTVLRWDHVAQLLRTEREWAEDETVWALLARTAHDANQHGQRVVVVDPAYTQLARDFLAAGQGQLDIVTHAFGTRVDPTTIVIPMNVDRNHWVIGIYETRTNTLDYFDTLHGELNRQRTDDMVAAIRRFYPEARPVPRDVPHRLYNRQTDGFNCGFHVALILEGRLTTPDHTTLIPNLSMPHERLRMITNLVSIFVGEDAPILPLRWHLQVSYFAGMYESHTTQAFRCRPWSSTPRLFRTQTYSREFTSQWARASASTHGKWTRSTSAREHKSCARLRSRTRRWNWA
jgi:Ulp1 protease family, C-terminal catalytic domain